MYYSCVKFSQYQFVRLGVALSRNKKWTDGQGDSYITLKTLFPGL